MTGEWMDISTAPRDGTVILIAGAGAVQPWVTCSRWTDAGWYEINLDDTDCHSHPDYPTHWMPLPDPPKEQK